MSRSQGWVLVIGIVIGNISGYIFAENKSIDTDQLASIIRTELQVIMSHQSTSQFSSDTLKINSTEQLFIDGEKERFMDELKETFRDVAQEIVMKETSMQQNIVASNNTRTHADQERIQAAIIESQDLLTGAIARGRWSSEDSRNYDVATRKLSGEELADAYRKLSVAINNGEITPDPDSVVY